MISRAELATQPWTHRKKAQLQGGWGGGVLSWYWYGWFCYGLCVRCDVTKPRRGAEWDVETGYCNTSSFLTSPSDSAILGCSKQPAAGNTELCYLLISLSSLVNRLQTFLS